MAVGMRLRLDLCILHRCQCGSDVDAQGRHAMVCKKVPGKIARHQGLNDVIWWALNVAGIFATKEPSGLNKRGGKRPDGLTLIPWQGGKFLIWDVTVASTLAASYADITATGAGLVADQAADKKADKYADFTEFSSLMRWKTWSPTLLQHWSSSAIWIRELVTFLATRERPSFILAYLCDDPTLQLGAYA